MEQYKEILEKLNNNFVILSKNGIILDIEAPEFGTLIIKYHNGMISSVEKQENKKF